MNIYQDYIQKLKIDVILSIISSYEKFEKEGSIGDEPIRQHTEWIMKENKMPEHLVTIFMKDLAFECYRHLAKFVRDDENINHLLYKLVESSKEGSWSTGFNMAACDIVNHLRGN